MILNQQMIKFVEDVKGDMTKGQSGTSSTLFLKTQTGLQTAVGATNVTLSDKTNTDVSVFVNHVITTSIGNGSALVEFEVNNGTTSYNRVVKASLDKTSQIEYNVFHTFDFEVVV